jgi:hypothetical protein
MPFRPDSRATSQGASGPGSKAALFSAVSSSTTTVTGCLRPIQCVGETVTAITPVRRTCGAARQLRDPVSVPVMWSDLSWRSCADDRTEMVTHMATNVWSAEIRELVQTTVDRIIIQHDHVEITLKCKEMDRAIDGDNQSKSLTTIMLALPPPRPRERKEILIPGASRTQPRRIDQHSSWRSRAQGHGCAGCGRVNL